jgi:hypothetical protein
MYDQPVFLKIRNPLLKSIDDSRYSGLYDYFEWMLDAGCGSYHYRAKQLDGCWMPGIDNRYRKQLYQHPVTSIQHPVSIKTKARPLARQAFEKFISFIYDFTSCGFWTVVVFATAVFEDADLLPVPRSTSIGAATKIDE